MKKVPLISLPVDKQIINFIKEQKDITIDKYSSKGGNGELFFGTHNILKTRVALKFYYFDSKSAHEEVQLLYKTKHQNILEVLDAKIISDEYAYFLTPEVSGGDLDKFLNSYLISTDTAIEILKGILSGVTALHSSPNRLVHRDLKPANILIGSDYIPKIADFGSIKHIPDGEDKIAGSRHSFIYRPPESILSDEYCFQSDIYQIGVVLFQLLGGYFPYNEHSWLNSRERRKHSIISDEFERQQYFNEIAGNHICKGTLLKMDTLPPYVCRSLKSIIRTATHPEPSSRFQTTSEFLKSIHDYTASGINWWNDNNTYYAEKEGQFQYRISISNSHISVHKLTKSNSWRADNQIAGSLSNICKIINNI